MKIKNNKSRGKLRKALASEVNEVFTLYLNGHLEMTRDEIREHMEQLENLDIKEIRKKKCELKEELDNLFADERD